MTRLDDFQKRYLDELAAAATMLSTFESAAQAEAWASGAVAEWQALSGSSDALITHLADSTPFAAELIAWFEGGEVTLDSEHEWVRDLGRCELTRVLRVTEPGSPDDFGLILEYGLDGEPDHDVSVSIEDGRLTGVTIGPTGLIDGIDGLKQGGIEQDSTDRVNLGQRNGLVAIEEDPATAMALITTALAEPFEELSATTEANIPLLVRRMGSGRLQVMSRSTSDQRILPDSRDREAELWCVGVLQAALRSKLASPAPASIDTAVATFEALVANGDPDANTLLEVADIGAESLDSLDVLLVAIGAYFAPVDLSAHSKVAFDALTLIEPVDWLGVVLGLARSSTSTPPIDGAALVTFINRAPEITTTISKKEAPQIAWTFDQMLFAWETTGVITEEGAVTDAGRWLIGRAFVRALG